jgi:hypothetical protein
MFRTLFGYIPSLENIVAEVTNFGEEAYVKEDSRFLERAVRSTLLHAEAVCLDSRIERRIQRLKTLYGGVIDRGSIA